MSLAKMLAEGEDWGLTFSSYTIVTNLARRRWAPT